VHHQIGDADFGIAAGGVGEGVPALKTGGQLGAREHESVEGGGVAADGCARILEPTDLVAHDLGVAR
jgi:hypothetical protein